jgi:hypothetical protein
LKSISQALEIFYNEKGYYPEPSSTIAVTYSGTTLWKQGKFDDQLFRIVSKISKKPLDPLNGVEYAYSLTYQKGEYQLAAAFESNNISYEPLISQASAEYKYAIIKGNYNGKMISATIGTGFYIF